MKLRLRMQGEDGAVTAEEVDLKVKSPHTTERMLDAGREFAKAKGLVLLSIQNVQPPTDERKRKRGR